MTMEDARAGTYSLPHFPFAREGIKPRRCQNWENKICHKMPQPEGIRKLYKQRTS